ncbi:hypothetical protein G9A89_008875 [Geosiphon pyriformis]|nr:hypothetical protein G9A89_008875 [Geosiphon pyriformis]
MFTPSKFTKIIRTIFTSKLSLMQTTKKTKSVKILVNTNLKKSVMHLNQIVVLKKIPIDTLTKIVHTVLSEFRLIKSVKIQLRNTSGNCKDSLREDPRQWVDFSSASEKEYINTHNNQELKNNLHCNSKKKAFSVTVTLSHK